MRITSAAVFNKLMLFMLKEANGLFLRLLGLDKVAAAADKAADKAADGATGGGAPGASGKAGAQGAPQQPLVALTHAEVAKSPRWRKVAPLARSYLGNSLHLLGQMTEAAMLTFTLKRLRASVPLLGSFEAFTKKYLKAALDLWGASESATVRVQVRPRLRN